VPTWLIVLLPLPVVIYFVLVVIYYLYSRNNMPAPLDAATCYFESIVVLSFGTTREKKMLAGNEYLARIVCKFCHYARNRHRLAPTRFPMPILVVQEEVANAIKELYNSRSPTVDYTIKSRSQSNAYVGSLEVLLSAIEQYRRLSVDKVLIIVHPAMYIRINMLARELGLENFEVLVISEVYDPESDQVWTRYPILFWALEPLKYLVDSLRAR